MKELYKIGDEVLKSKFTMKYASSIYFLTLNRVSRRFTSLELSFLLGQDDEFVGELERFKHSTNNLELIVGLRNVFRGAEWVLKNADDEGCYPFELTIGQVCHGVSYRMEYYLNETESILFYHLIDDTSYDENHETAIEEQILIEIALHEFIDAGYFKKLRTPLEIYERTQTWLLRRVRPMSLKLILDTFWGRKGKAPLKRTKQRSFGYRFQAHRREP